MFYPGGVFIITMDSGDSAKKEGHETEIACKSRFTEKGHPSELKEDLKGWTEKRFQDSDALIFVGATGITVRTIAPYIKDKRQDPAVIVLDERGEVLYSASVRTYRRRQ